MVMYTQNISSHPPYVMGFSMPTVSTDILLLPLPPTDWIEDLMRESWINHKESQKALKDSQAVVMKLSGLVGSLKSIILHMDPEKGRALLKGEIAAMEEILFGPIVRTVPKGGRKKSTGSMNKSKKYSEADGTVIRTDGLMIRSVAESGPVELPIEVVEPDLMALEDYGLEAEEDEGNAAMTALVKPRPAGPIILTPKPEGNILESMMDTTNASVSTLGSEEFPVGSPSERPVIPKQVPSQAYHHPRVPNSMYWKEFSTQTRAQIEQAAKLEAAMKKRDGWSLSSIFS